VMLLRKSFNLFLKDTESDQLKSDSFFIAFEK